jgi:hypothetical protein
MPVDLHTAGAMAVDPLDAPSHKTTPFERRFEAYDFNGGYVFLVVLWIATLHSTNQAPLTQHLYLALSTTVCIAGPDFAIAAGCTRMSTGYEILSRNQTKLFEL